MNKPYRVRGFVLLLLCAGGLLRGQTPGSELPPWVPDSLKPWVPWVLYGHEDRTAPPRWDQGDARRPVWPGHLALEADDTGARFVLEARTFAEDWVTLPGDETLWPQEVTGNGKPLPVLTRAGRPVVRVPAGLWRIEGRFLWRGIPLRMRVPAEAGTLELTVSGQPVPVPQWDAEGWLWFRQPPAPKTEEAQPDFLSADWFALLEDGNPQWLRVEVQLSVAGRPREERVGTVLPEGWLLAAVRSPLPVFVEEGRLRVQVRPGQWTVELDAFRYGHQPDLRFPEGARVPGAPVLIGLQSRPEFRVVELRGGEPVDASQTRYPERWRGWPVYRWDIREPLQIVERQKGEGTGPVASLQIRRTWWLDEDGRAVTFQDRIQAQGQKLWRLDVTPGIELGSVRLRGEPQLLTRHPTTGRPGFEVRLRDFDVEAVGRFPLGAPVPGGGWEITAEQVETVLHLPVGWSLLAAFGPDEVKGDWLRRWTLLDLFAVLVLALAVQQLLGWRAGLLALITAALIYHEPRAPHWSWWGVVVIAALIRLARTPRAALALGGLWVLASLALALCAVVFAGLQLRKALHPQLEPPEGVVLTLSAAEEGRDAGITPTPTTLPLLAPPSPRRLAGALEASAAQVQSKDLSARSDANLAWDASAKVQTGPGIPEWRWRTASWRWNGPVRPDQTVHLWLIPPWLERMLSLGRALLTLALAWVLVRAARPTAASPSGRSRPAGPAGQVAAATAGAVLLVCGSCFPAGAEEFPPPQLLNELRDRLLAAPPAFPGAAEVPWARLQITNQNLVLQARIEAAARCAVPVPARMNQWAPARVWLDGQPTAALRREDGSLWIVAEPGVHEVRVEGRMAPVDEWVWSFQLRPRRVEVVADGWQVSGINPEGVPSDQVFLHRVRSAMDRTARLPNPALSGNYGEQPLAPAFLTVRELELGLRWKVRTTVQRLSPPGRAVVVRIPLLPGEQILTGGLTTHGQQVEARFGPGQVQFVWESELTVTNDLSLQTRTNDEWAEEWCLRVGPVWNVSFEGLPPVYEAGPMLVPVWRPWPGEAVRLQVRRPEAVPGFTVTVESVAHLTRVGHRMRSTELTLRINSSLGQDFVLTLPEQAESVEVRRDARSLPLQKMGQKVTIPLVPGRQSVLVSWKEAVPLGARIRPSPVQLPVEASNVQQTVELPKDRWVLSTRGPRLGPAVQYWSVLALAAVLAVLLSALRAGPPGPISWFLLLVGLTQVPVWLGWLVVAWFAALQLRGSWALHEQRWWLADLAQLILVGLTFCAAVVLYLAVRAGLLGEVQMFVSGNGSSTWTHHWFTARSGPDLPRPECLAISLWWYRLAMLAWSLWLALSLLRWLRWAWKQFTAGGSWAWPKPATKPPKPPPPLAA